VTEAEADRVTELFTLAFYDDPPWGWAFPDPDQRMDQHGMWWGLYMHSALAYGWVWMTKDGGAAALWIPPGEPELSDENEARVEPLLRELLGSHADHVLALLDRFEANHPRHAPHYYLSLLGTHPDHRGRGKGMGFSPRTSPRSTSRAVRPTWSRAIAPTTTATSALGFVQVGQFAAPCGGPTVACMWRDPR
jgi:hypothetical protein